MNENSFDYSEQVRNSIAETEDKQVFSSQLSVFLLFFVTFSVVKINTLFGNIHKSL